MKFVYVDARREGGRVFDTDTGFLANRPLSALFALLLNATLPRSQTLYDAGVNDVQMPRPVPKPEGAWEPGRQGGPECIVHVTLT